MHHRRMRERGIRAVRAGLIAAVALLATVTLGACAEDEPAAPQAVSAPDDLVATIDQSRFQRVGRKVYVRLTASETDQLRVTRAEISSPRFDDVVWTGEAAFDQMADLEFALPVGRCGSGSDVEVRLTYTVGEGPVRESTITATDVYGAVGRFLDRDCASAALSEAATLEVGEPRVVGDPGPASVWEVPVVLTPTGERDDVVVRGFEDTVLFAQVAGSASASEGGTRVRLRPGDPPATLTLRVPARCDPHVLAEDKVGTLFPIVVEAPDIPADARPYLPLADSDRAALRSFVPAYCEW